MRWHIKAIRSMAALGVAFALVACGGGGGDSSGGSSGASGGSNDATSGEAFQAPGDVNPPAFDPVNAVSNNDGLIDIGSVNQGVVMASATSASRLKLLVTCGEMSYNYDMPGDGTPITAPINMGNGTYTFAIMRNVEGNNYVETTSATADVTLESETIPFTQPNMYCNYSSASACVAKAKELTEGCENVGDAVRAICTYIVDNVDYDTDKAAELSQVTGYVPNPDETFATNKGICFDYASLGAAMLRSQGIPTKIVTGYVSPNDLYHAWIMIYIEGSWTSAKFSVNPESWSRVDLTFGADSSSEGLVGDGKSYTERYVY